MKVKLKSIPGLLPEIKKPHGFINNIGIDEKGYNQALSDCGEREVEIDEEVLEGIIDSCTDSSAYHDFLKEGMFIKMVKANLPQLLRAVKSDK